MTDKMTPEKGGCAACTEPPPFPQPSGPVAPPICHQSLPGESYQAVLAPPIVQKPPAGREDASSSELGNSDSSVAAAERAGPATTKPSAAPRDVGGCSGTIARKSGLSPQKLSRSKSGGGTELDVERATWKFLTGSKSTTEMELERATRQFLARGAEEQQQAAGPSLEDTWQHNTRAGSQPRDGTPAAAGPKGAAVGPPPGGGARTTKVAGVKRPAPERVTECSSGSGAGEGGEHETGFTAENSRNGKHCRGKTSLKLEPPEDEPSDVNTVDCPEADAERPSPGPDGSGEPRAEPAGPAPPHPPLPDKAQESKRAAGPTTKAEKAKQLRTALVGVSKKMPRNAHAQFYLGLMHQRAQQPTRAAQAYERALETLRNEEGSSAARAALLSTVQAHLAQCKVQAKMQEKPGSQKEGDASGLEAAMKQLGEVAGADASSLAIWNNLASMLLQNGRYEVAILVLTSLLSLTPDNVDALANLGVAHLHSGQTEKAARCLQSALLRDKMHTGALNAYAVLILHHLGTLPAGASQGTAAGRGSTAAINAARRAEQCLDAALSAEPRASHLWANLAAVHMASGNISCATRCLDQAVALDPGNLAIRYAGATLRLRDSDPDTGAITERQQRRASQDMISVIRDCEPSPPGGGPPLPAGAGPSSSSSSRTPPTGLASYVPRSVAWGGLAMVHRIPVADAPQGEPPPPAGTTANGGPPPGGGGSWAVAAGAKAKAAQEHTTTMLQKAVEEGPESFVAWHQLGVHMLSISRFESAQECFKEAITRRPDSSTAWSNLGIALQMLESGHAEQAYQRALQFSPQQQMHSILSNIGSYYRQNKRMQLAWAALDRALALCPGHAPTANNLGLVHVAESRWQEAATAFAGALRSDPHLPAAQANSARAKAQHFASGPNPTTNAQPTCATRNGGVEPSHPSVMHGGNGLPGGPGSGSEAHPSHQRSSAFGMNPYDTPCSRPIVADSPQYFSRPPSSGPSQQGTKPEYPPFIN